MGGGGGGMNMIEVINTLSKIKPDMCPDCGVDMYTEIEEHSSTREFLVYRCPQCHETFTYLAVSD